MVAERVRETVKAPERPARAEVRENQPTVLIEDALRQDTGKPLDPTVRGPMEARLGHDFSRVRIHDDVAADRAAQALNAVAFTYGDHIFFEDGAYDLGSLAGRRLLAQELVHVAQTRTRSVPAQLTITQPDSPLEQEARSIADEVTADDTTSTEVLTTQVENRYLVARQMVRDRAAEIRDPDRAIDTLIWIIIRNLRADPLDRAGRIRRQFERLDAQTQTQVMERLEGRLSDAQLTQLHDLLAQEAPGGTEVSTPSVDTNAEVSETTPQAEAETATEESAAPETQAEAETEPPAEVAAAPEAETEAETQPAVSEPEAEIAAQSEEKTSEAEIAAEAETAQTVAEETETTQSEDAEKPEVEQGEGGEQAPAAAEAAGTAEDQAMTSAPAIDTSGGGTETVDEGVLNRTEEVLLRNAGVSRESEQTAVEPASVEQPVPGMVSLGQADVTSPTTTESVEAELPESTDQAQVGTAGEVVTDEASESLIQHATDVAPSPEQPIDSEAETAPQGSTLPVSVEADDTAMPQPGASIPAAIPEPSSGGETAPAVEPQEEREPSDEALLTLENAVHAENTAPQTEAVPAVEPIAETPEAQASLGAAPTEVAIPSTGAAPAETSEVETPAGDLVTAPSELAESEPLTPGEAMPQPEGIPTQQGEAGAPGQDGGSCQNAEPVPEQASGGDSSGGCGTGGGGGAAAPPTEQATPAPAAEAEPTAAMGQVEGMAPAEAGVALNGVSQSATQSMTERHQELSAAPPEMERPTGIPAGTALQVPTTPASPNNAPAAASPNRVSPELGAPSAVQSTPTPSSSPLPQAQSPRLPGNAELSPNDVQQVRAAVDSLPTADPALNVTVETPALSLDGEANPTQVSQQDTAVATSIDSAHTGAQQDAAQPMGESQVYPVVQPETLRPDPQTESDQDCGGNSNESSGAQVAPNDPVAIVAREQGAGQVRAAAARARGYMAGGQQQQEQDSQTERANTQQQMDEEVAHNADQQAQARTGVQRDVQQQRTEWTQERTTLVTDAQTERDGVQRDNAQEIERERNTGNAEAARHVREGNTQIATVRRDAETRADNQRERARNETNSGGFFSWLSSRVTAFFNEIKQAIQTVFEAARRAIQTFVQRFQELAMRAIEAARRVIVSAIEAAGALLIAIGDRVLAAFPELRERFRNTIQGLVDTAVETVNALADALKEGIKRLLNLLMAALIAILNALKCVYMAAINFVARAVQAVIEAARSFAQGLGQFIELIGDIAENPGQWLRNLGSSAVSGIRNCLWSAFKTAVKNWFNAKVEEVLGLGLMIYRVLLRGCINIAQVGTMAWEGLKTAIPVVLITLLIEKLVSMIIPAAGAILTIIQGLIAAWGTVSRIITAFQLFFAFLKAVKGGNAGGQFAAAVAAAAVVVIDFVANWLLQRLMRPARAVGGRLRAIAQRIMQRLGRTARSGVQASRRVMGRVTQGVRSGARAVAGGVRRTGTFLARGTRALGRTPVIRIVLRPLRRVSQVLSRPLRRAFGSVSRTWRRTTAALQQRLVAARARFRRWRDRRRQQRERDRTRRQEVARRETQMQLERLLSRGVNGWMLRFHLTRLRLYYRWRSLRLQRDATRWSFSILGGFSPENEVAQGSEKWEVVLVNYQLPSESLLSGAAYEESVFPQYIIPVLAPQVASGRALEIVRPGQPTLDIPADPAHRYRSTIDIARLRIQRGMRGPGGMQRRPEGIMEIAERQGRRRIDTAVHLFEATLITNFMADNQFAAHKRVQVPGTLFLLQQRYADNPNIQIVYHIIAPRQPDQATKDFLMRQIKGPSMRNVRFIWRVLGG